jgi:tubulin--tyrosine ligase-like protein 12
MFGVDTSGEINGEEVKNQILEKFWKFANCYHVSGDKSSSIWFLMDEMGSAVGHSSEPNVVCVPFMFIQPPPSGSLSAQPQLTSFSIMWPVRDIDFEDYVERDYCPWITTPIDRIAHLADWINGIDEDLIAQLTKGAEYHEELLSEITNKGGSFDINIFEGRGNPTFVTNRQAPVSPPSLWEGKILKVYTTAYDPLRLRSEHGGLTHASFTLVDSKEEADILWLSDPVKPDEAAEFWLSSTENDQSQTVRFVNQFPYEGLFCLKDNLTREIARCLGSPSWWKPTFDLETQLPLFVGHYLNSQKKQQDIAVQSISGAVHNKDYNIWIAKPNNSTRSVGHVVSSSLIRIIRSLEIDKSRIVQKYIEKPLLFQGKYKFDMRFVVLVRSLELGKEEVYVYNDFWCRVANKSHHIETTSSVSESDEGTTNLNRAVLEDPESYLTAAYVLPGVQQRAKIPSCDDVIASLMDSYPFLDWNKIYENICNMLRELFLGLPRGQEGKMHAPKARALYGCDVMLEAVTNSFGEVIDAQPKLLEVTFTPSNNATMVDTFEKIYPSYVNDVFGCLFLGEQVNVKRLL